MKFWKNRTEIKEEEDAPWDIQRYKDEARRILEVSWHIMITTKWQLEKQSSIGEVYSGISPEKNKIYRVKGAIDVPPQELVEIIFDKPQEWPNWNPVIVESLLLEQVDERTSVTYQVTAAQLGGLVARRDFVELARWAPHWADGEEGTLLLASASVPHPRAPPPRAYIRGENRPGCYVIRPVPGCPRRSLVEWSLDTNLKGWLPQRVLHAAFAAVMLANLSNLKRRAEARAAAHA